MARLTVSRHINAPVEAVYAACSDFERAPEMVSAIQKIEILTPGPIRVGTRFKETRVMFGKPCTEEMEVASLEHNKEYSLRGYSCGAEFTTHFRFKPEAGGTNVEMLMETRARSLFAWLFAPLSFLFMGMMRKCVEGDMDDVTSYCERRSKAAGNMAAP